MAEHDTTNQAALDSLRKLYKAMRLRPSGAGSFQNGAWSPDYQAIQERAAQLLKDDYGRPEEERSAFSSAALNRASTIQEEHASFDEALTEAFRAEFDERYLGVARDHARQITGSEIQAIDEEVKFLEKQVEGRENEKGNLENALSEQDERNQAKAAEQQRKAAELQGQGDKPGFSVSFPFLRQSLAIAREIGEGAAEARARLAKQKKASQDAEVPASTAFDNAEIPLLLDAQLHQADLNEGESLGERVQILRDNMNRASTLAEELRTRTYSDPGAQEFLDQISEAGYSPTPSGTNEALEDPAFAQLWHEKIGDTEFGNVIRQYGDENDRILVDLSRLEYEARDIARDAQAAAHRGDEKEARALLAKLDRSGLDALDDDPVAKKFLDRNEENVLDPVLKDPDTVTASPSELGEENPEPRGVIDKTKDAIKRALKMIADLVRRLVNTLMKLIGLSSEAEAGDELEDAADLAIESALDAEDDELLQPG